MTIPSTESLEAEQASFDATVRDIEAWWATPRQQHVQRPWTARTVAALRGSQTLPCVSSPAALKLWALLKDHHKNKTSELTFGATDPVGVSQMAKYMRTVYVSGGLSGFSENAYPGMDHADYPWDTVPKVVDKIFRSQVWHDQRQRQYRMSLPASERAAAEHWDYLMPIVADGDMGFGSLTVGMKAAKALAELGAAAIHIDDLALGLKKFTTGQGRTVVPTSEYRDRVKAIRLQLDVLGAETLIFARCDTDHAEFITSVADARDHAYVLGATNPAFLDKQYTLQQAIAAAAQAGQSAADARASWMQEAGLATFDEAVAAAATAAGVPADKVAAYTARTGYGTSLQQRRAAAQSVLGLDVPFDWELPRSAQGQYLFRQTVQTIVERALVVAPLSDLSWARMDQPNYHDLKAYHEAVTAALGPDRMFAFAWGGEWPFPASAGWTDERRKEASQILSDWGVVWQVQPMYMIQGVNMEIERAAALWTDGGMGAYYEQIQTPAVTRTPYKVDGYEKMTWCGGHLSDAFFSAVAGEEIAKK
ncbi:isocitrate lyase [Sporothrix schenckii 1099-18]|uniref:Isocitrate lyase n=1 Tax=Sporothrix schenckii 1099-18 TaxID=1397361 RepID=A0A0F2M5B1_SPOSC|nr:isocitrate lyase [Sporothrix schenckii 1099-18]KJR84289.1 isocitrate lyase [Sporothrix schenckii 1099-18]